jgi:hypothetical protein
MKKLLIIAILACASVFTASAQSNQSSGSQAKFSIGLEGAAVLGSYTDVYNFGYGVSFKTDIPAAKNLDFTLSVGYTNFPIKDDIKALLQASGSSQSSAGFIPLKAGLKLYESGGFYMEGQLGASFATTGGGGAGFAYSPGVGYKFDSGFDIGLRYEGWAKNGATLSQLGLRLAYNFK